MTRLWLLMPVPAVSVWLWLLWRGKTAASWAALIVMYAAGGAGFLLATGRYLDAAWARLRWSLPPGFGGRR